MTSLLHLFFFLNVSFLVEGNSNSIHTDHNVMLNLHDPDETCDDIWYANHQILAGPGDRASWLANLEHMRTICRKDFNGSIYEIPELMWTQKNYVTNQMHPMDRYFWDKDKQIYTMDRYLEDLKVRHGGLDSIMIWPSYPNLGIDDRNQFDLFRSLPGGTEGLKGVISILKSKGVRVLLAYNPWDTQTRPLGISDEEALGNFAKEVGADGYNMDTCVGATAKQHAGCPFCAFEPEGYTNWYSRDYLTLAWAKSWGSSLDSGKPGADIVKLSLDSRWMSMGSARGSWNYTKNLHLMFFNGVGFNAWENLWGDFHKMVPHDGELCRRSATILRYFGNQGYLISKDWMPFAEEIKSDIAYGTKFPGKDGILFLLVNMVGREAHATVIVNVPYSATYYDCYHGKKLTNSGTVSITLEPLGIGCVFVTNKSSEDLDIFLKNMETITATPLQNFSFKVDILPMSFIYHNETEKKHSNCDTSKMISFDATSYHYKVEVMACESGGLQYPWERNLNYKHDHTMDLPAFCIDKYPVTNHDYKTFLDATGYTPRDSTNWLRDWNHSSTGTVHYLEGREKNPVTWLNMQEAMDYCSWRGARLPQSYEWQYAAQGNDMRPYPWGTNPGTDGIELPKPATDRSKPLPYDVDAHPKGCSPSGVCDLIGNVWQYTDLFVTDKMLQYVLRGGSTYSRFLAKLYVERKASSYYFPCVGSPGGQDGGLKLNSMAHFLAMGNSSYERSGTVGFRCAADPQTPPPTPSPPTPPTPPTWVEHAGNNCYPGHGADIVPGGEPYSTDMTLAECEAACELSTDCTGIVRPANADKGACFRRMHIDLSKCDVGPAWNLWLKPLAFGVRHL